MMSIRHVDLVVSSVATSLLFYKGFLVLLGWQQTMEVVGEQGETITYLAGPSGFSQGAIGLREVPSGIRSVEYQRYNLGMHHVAFNAPDNATVDQVASWLRRNQADIESGPTNYYDSDYYAVFFYDPDGIKLEVVCGPGVVSNN